MPGETGAGLVGMVPLVMAAPGGRGDRGRGALWHLRDLGSGLPLAAGSVTCQLFDVSFLKL